jgi:hypothetical protein
MRWSSYALEYKQLYARPTAVDVTRAGCAPPYVVASLTYDVTKYEEVVEEYTGHWIKRVHDYRDIWIAVLMPKNDERAVIRVVGIRQNFVTDKEMVELIRERDMLVENI